MGKLTKRLVFDLFMFIIVVSTLMHMDDSFNLVDARLDMLDSTVMSVAQASSTTNTRLMKLENVDFSRVLPVYDSTITVTDGQGHGSGVIFKDGYVLTAAHVAEHENLTVITMGGQEFLVVNQFISAKYDVAVLEVPGVVGSIEFADPETLQLFDTVIMIGTPLDLQLCGTITTGVISSLDRDIYHWEDAYQVSAVSAPGSSGCPVITMEGKLVGLLVGGPGYTCDPYSICESVVHVLETIEESDI